MNTRHTTPWLLLLTMALVGLTLFAGCRAFQPEAVIVNKAPETFLVGAPLAGGGAYFHYHVFWYGSDEDGFVKKFVWALTDTTVQNDNTSDDEEDSRFNPALDITHLEIGNWTTRNDSVFDFQINQGTTQSVGMTLHMVAMDDFGDFDRTPARLHFFSNTLGTPGIEFFRVEGEDLIPLDPDFPDTVGFGQPYELRWSGFTPNVFGFDENALALVDTVYPFDDGLFGFKWQLGGELGGDCISSFTDCWHPRKFNEATGDSFSFFAEVNGLSFKNDHSSVDDPFGMLLDNGIVELMVNSIDMAGVEVSESERLFQLMVNYDPETILLNGEADPHYDDDTVYPFYTMLDDPTQTHYPFVEGERIPDRSYVVFKAMARDDPRDGQANPDFKIGLNGTVTGVRDNYLGGTFRFSSGASEIDYDPQWSGNAEGWYADTLGFLVGPRTEFTFSMQAIDEHERRDGTPATFRFEVGYPPCVQCVELFPGEGHTSEVAADLDCYVAGTPDHVCFGETDTFYILRNGQAPLDGRVYLESNFVQKFIAINKTGNHSARFVDEDPDPATFWSFEMAAFSMGALLHGKDDPREVWSDRPESRVGSWRYQVDYDCDPGNVINDGGGLDGLDSPTWTPSDGFSISPDDGLWALDVDVFIPKDLFLSGMMVFRFWVAIELGAESTEELIDEVVSICLRQMSPGSLSVVALDQTKCSQGGITRPAMYHLFNNVRPPESGHSGTWRDCSVPNNLTVVSTGLERHAMDSAEYDANGDQIPVEKYFNLLFQGHDGTQVVDWQCDGSR